MNVYIIIGIILILIIIITITIILIVTHKPETTENSTNDDIKSNNTKELPKIQPKTTDNTKTQNINNNTSDVSGNTIVSNTPLHVNIVTGSENPNVVKTYNNNSETTDINVNENVNKQNVTDEKKIINKNLSNISNDVVNSNQTNTFSFP